MASIGSSNSATICSFHRKPISQNLILSPFLISFPLYKSKLCAIKIGPDGAAAVGSSQEAADLLRKTEAAPAAGIDDDDSEMKSGDGDTCVHWEDQILEYTAPLVGFVRMILHSGKYKSGDRLSPEHERIILERLLPYHPECEEKIGCGIDYITIGYHPDFESSRCLFIVRKDGGLVDFSYWKCMKGLIRKNYPLYANSFFLRHFKGRHRRSDW